MNGNSPNPFSFGNGFAMSSSENEDETNDVNTNHNIIDTNTNDDDKNTDTAEAQTSFAEPSTSQHSPDKKDEEKTNDETSMYCNDSEDHNIQKINSTELKDSAQREIAENEPQEEIKASSENIVKEKPSPDCNGEKINEDEQREKEEKQKAIQDSPPALKTVMQQTSSLHTPLKQNSHPTANSGGSSSTKKVKSRFSSPLPSQISSQFSMMKNDANQNSLCHPNFFLHFIEEEEEDSRPTEAAPLLPHLTLAPLTTANVVNNDNHTDNNKNENAINTNAREANDEQPIIDEEQDRFVNNNEVEEADNVLSVAASSHSLPPLQDSNAFDSYVEETHVNESQPKNDRPIKSSAKAGHSKPVPKMVGEVPDCVCAQGGREYRRTPAYYCTYCSYIVCESCYQRIDKNYLESDEETSPSSSSSPVSDSKPHTALTPPHPPSPLAQARSSFCHLCQHGELRREAALLIPWSCEGPYPVHRVNKTDGGAYEAKSLDTFQSLRYHYGHRAHSLEPLKGQFHGLLPQLPPQGNGPQVMPVDYRAPCCPEGRAFAFSIHNPRLEQRVVWCGVCLDLRQRQPTVMAAGASTTIPLLMMRCPPTSAALPPPLQSLHVPPGLYSRYHVHALAAYLLEDIYLRAEMRPCGLGGLSELKVLPSIKPLLVVRLLHDATKKEEDINVEDGLKRPRSEMEQMDESVEEDNTDDELHCPEVEQCLRYLTNRRSVAVYGILSKHFFLEHVAQSAELLHHRVCMIDCSLGSNLRRPEDVAARYAGALGATQGKTATTTAEGGSASRVSPFLRPLRELGQLLREEQQRNTVETSVAELVSMLSGENKEKGEHPQLQKTFKHVFERVGRSPSPPRDANLNNCSERRSDEIVDVDEDSSSLLPKDEKLSMERGGEDRDLSPVPLPARDVIPIQPKEAGVIDDGDNENTTQKDSTKHADKQDKNAGLEVLTLPKAFAEEAEKLCQLNCSVLDLFSPQNTQKINAEVSHSTIHNHHNNHRKGDRSRAGRHTTTTSSDSLKHSDKKKYNHPANSASLLLPVHVPTVTCRSEALRQRLTQRLRRPPHCVQWRTAPHVQHTTIRPTLLVIHNIDFMEAEAESLLLHLLHRFPSVTLLTSFDQLQWAQRRGVALGSLNLALVHLRHVLRPRVLEMRYFDPLHIMSEYDRQLYKRGAVQSSSTAAAPRGHGSLPLQDTIKRILYSLPISFAELVKILVGVQEEAGEGKFVSLFVLVEKLEQHGIMISQGRLRALQKELTSNRLAVYDSVEHALCIPQYERLKKVLAEVEEERRSHGGENSIQHVQV